MMHEARYFQNHKEWRLKVHATGETLIYKDREIAEDYAARFNAVFAAGVASADPLASNDDAAGPLASPNDGGSRCPA